MKTLVAIFFISCCVYVVNSCGGGGRRPPPRCSWRTCSASWDPTWTPAPPATGGCVNQYRRVRHNYQTHHRNGGCPGSQTCRQGNMHRTWCNCKFKEYSSEFGEWELKSSNGDCRTIERKTKFVREVIHKDRANCNVHHNQRVETKTECACKIFTYTEKGFGNWKDKAGQEHLQCKEQERTMQYEQGFTLEKHLNNCPAPINAPSNPPKENRKVCLCEVNHFIETEWDEWKNNPGQGDIECVDQTRKMNYEKSGTTMDFMEKCPPVLSQPAKPKEDTRRICRPCIVLSYTYEPWSQWYNTPILSPEGCKQQKRKRKGTLVRKRAEKIGGSCPGSDVFAPSEFRKLC